MELNPDDYYRIDWDALDKLADADKMAALATIFERVRADIGAERGRMVHQAHTEHGTKRSAAEHLGMKPARFGQIYNESKEKSMATTGYGNFIGNCSDSGSSSSLYDYVSTALGDFAGDYDVDALVDDFRDAINAELEGTGVSLNGDEFYGPHPREDVDIAGAIEAVDFWQIAAKHEVE